jgi:hypothetical protein
MKNNQYLSEEFSIEELENRLEMKPWVMIDCPGDECGTPPYN